MADTAHRIKAPPEWLDILAESEAEAEAGLVVSGDEIVRELREAAERLEATQGAMRRG